MKETNIDPVAAEGKSSVMVEELVFEELEQRLVPMAGGCATSSSCSCSSSSCIFYAN